MDLQKLLGFLDLIHRFQQVERRIMRRGEERLENDVEHSYQLALLAWYINDTNRYGLDTDKLMRYALVHDLVEVYAGDTFAYDPEHQKTKEAREAEAATRIAAEFPEFPDLVDTMHAYERRNDRESKFVYALDKLIPTLGIYLDDGRTWMREGVTLAMMKSYKTDKIAESPEINVYFQEVIKLLEAQPGLFPRSLRE